MVNVNSAEQAKAGYIVFSRWRVGGEQISRGAKVKHPFLTSLRQAEQSYLELTDKFGLDPKSNQRLPQPKGSSLSRRERILAEN